MNSKLSGDCEDVQSKLQSVLDKDLSEVELQRAESHLKECPACAAIKRDLEFLADLTDSRLAVKAPENFDHLLRHRLDAKIGRPEHRLSPLLAWSVASAFFLVLFGFVSFFFTTDQKPTFLPGHQANVTPVVLPADPGTPGTHVFVPGEKSGMLLQVPVTVKITRQQLTQDFFLSEVSH